MPSPLFDFNMHRCHSEIGADLTMFTSEQRKNQDGSTLAEPGVLHWSLAMAHKEFRDATSFLNQGSF
jgi:hypothetical protein